MAESDDHYELAGDPHADDPPANQPHHPFRDPPKPGGDDPAPSPAPPPQAAPTPTPKPASARQFNRAKVDRDAFDAGSFNDLSAEERAKLADKAAAVQRKHLGEGIFVAVAPNGDIAEDKPCVTCGRNLKGTQLDQVCPDCGTLILRSVKGEHLKYSNAKWLSKIELGCTLIAGSLGLLLVGAVVMQVVGWIVSPATDNDLKLDPTMGEEGRRVLALLKMVIYLAVVLFRAGGFWLFTSAEPGLEADKPTKLDRSMARLCMLAAAGLMGAEAVLVLALGQTWLAELPLLSSVVGLVAIVFLCRYGVYLAHRVPDEPLAQQTRVVMLGWAVALPLVWVAQLTRYLLIDPVEGGSFLVTALAGLCQTVGGLGVLVLSFWSLILLLTYRARVLQAIEQGRSI